MSQYNKRSEDGRYSADFGWDPPLQTYFYTVYDLQAPDDDPMEGMVAESIMIHGINLQKMLDELMEKFLIIPDDYQVKKLQQELGAPAAPKAPGLQKMLNKLKQDFDL